VKWQLKKLISIVSILLLLSLVACSENSTNAKLPNGYIEVSEDELTGGTLTVVKHKETGCYYTLFDGFKAGAFTQMFVEKNGQTVPYCEK
jgi:hypothetical protein